MKGFNKFWLFVLFSSFLFLSSCENAELNNCKEKASALWDNSQNPANKNAAYWQAVEKCKEKYQ